MIQKIKVLMSWSPKVEDIISYEVYEIDYDNKTHDFRWYSYVRTNSPLSNFKFDGKSYYVENFVFKGKSLQVYQWQIKPNNNIRCNVHLIEVDKLNK